MARAGGPPVRKRLSGLVDRGQRIGRGVVFDLADQLSGRGIEDRDRLFRDQGISWQLDGHVSRTIIWGLLPRRDQAGLRPMRNSSSGVLVTFRPPATAPARSWAICPSVMRACGALSGPPLNPLSQPWYFHR